MPTAPPKWVPNICQARAPSTQPLGADAGIIVQAIDGELGRSMEAFDVDVIEHSTSIVDPLPTGCSPGVVSVYWLPSLRPVEIVVSAPGYVTQRRHVTLNAAPNHVYFWLGKPGMDYYSQGGFQVPYWRSKARYVVLAPSGPRSNARALRAARTGASLTFVESMPRPLAWYTGFVEAEVSVRGDDRLAIGALARHLHDHPEHGQLAVTLNERGACFTGELVVTFSKALDAAELTAFADRYDLFVTHSRPGETTFAMKTPDAAFPELVEKVKREPSVRSVESTVIAPIEIDTTHSP